MDMTHGYQQTNDISSKQKFAEEDAYRIEQNSLHLNGYQNCEW